jgi:hypothetical protein
MRCVAGVAVAVCLACSSAYAQSAPDSTPPPAPAMPPQGVMANRWALTVGLGGQTLKAGDDNIGFLTYELGVRFRIIRALEVAVTLGTAANRADSYGGVWVDARYNFLAERNWNVYADLGLGLAGAAAKGADDNDDSARGSFRLSAGVERRFGVFSLSAELRVLTIGSNTNADAVTVPTPETELAGDSSAGIGFVISSTYYF